MTQARAVAPEAGAPPIQAERIAGAVLEVSDLAATRAFYEPIFRDVAGAWMERAGQLAFQTPRGTIAFTARRRPRTFADGGHHHAYRVRRDRVLPLVDELKTAGHQVDWWREDHPAERAVIPYLQDPSGNRVQIVPSDDDDGQLLDHVAIEVYEFDYCEYLYITSLLGHVDHYYGWRTRDQGEAKLWGEGDDPCAPWTRRDNPHYRDFLVEDPQTGDLRPARFGTEMGVQSVDRRMRVARPNGQVSITYGPSRLCLISATRVRQEPREEQVKGTPRIVFSAPVRAADAEAHLGATHNPYRREGASIYLRDADGNFSELICQG